jgi:hypothetical protein
MTNPKNAAQAANKEVREAFELSYAMDADDPTSATELSHFINGWRACIMSQVRAPVAGEAVTDKMIQAGARAAREYFERTGGNDPAVIYRAMRAAVPAAPEASAEPARILFPSHLRKMRSGGEVQAWLDQHQGVTPPPATAKGSLARYRQWKAEQDQAAAPCTCPSGDGSLRHPCPAHLQTNKGQA